MRPASKEAAQSGALAQLGERNTGSVEVSGSIPLGSTKYPQKALGESSGLFCGYLVEPGWVRIADAVHQSAG